VVYFPEGGVDAALAAFEKLVAPEVVGLDVTEAYAVDGKLEEIDGTPRFERVGGAVAIATLSPRLRPAQLRWASRFSSFSAVHMRGSCLCPSATS